MRLIPFKETKTALTADSQEHRRELRVDAFGRFGNYFFANGWQTVHHANACIFRYLLPGESKAAPPEFSFYYQCEEAVASYTRAPSALRRSARFLHLFWINDGYRTRLDASTPAHLSVIHAESAEILAEVRVNSLRDYDPDFLIATVQKCEDKSVWRNRLILEILPSLPPSKQLLFHQQALSAIGWKSAEPAFLGSLERDIWPDVAEARLQFYGQAVALTPASYIGTDLAERFKLSAEALDRFSPSEALRDAFQGLHKIDPPYAFRYALCHLSEREWTRREVAAFFSEYFPRNTRWWLKSVLEADHLGPEQAAEALNLAGASARQQNQLDFARFCFALAQSIHPQSHSPLWNLGVVSLESGEVIEAANAFAGVTRHYPDQSLSTLWPSHQGIAWPRYSSVQASDFHLPEGVDSWPRISIITPSFNQAPFIEETLLSVLNQQYPNLQYIVVDGQSTDGTVDILERYRHRLDHLIIEPDDGQTQAINKGLRLADGEIIAWLNSDDLFGPGALHMVALAWLQSRADLLAGICAEHTDRRILLVNKPAARNADFNPPQLARIFRYWLKGHYFYQPEVFFTKRILDQVGLLDESLHYAMDYDLWMLFSKAGARLEVVDWPVAFFRKHEAQKTFNLVDTVEEQARVRGRHLALQPDEQRLAQINRMLAPLRDKKPLHVGILTKRIGKIFSKNMQEDLDLFCGPDTRCHLSHDENDPDIATSDVIIMLVHLQDDLEVIRRLRAQRPDRPIVGWFWDNHHHLFENHAVAEQLDIVIPGHAIYSEYLRNDHALQAQPVPLCVTQWTRQEAAKWFEAFGNQERSPALYGGFVDYAFEPKRMEFLQSAMKEIPEHALRILSEANLAEYFGRSEKERFEEWCRYQTSLVLPLRNDLSQRVFDALLAGQIPLVPEEIKDLDLVVPRKLQQSLPILRFKMGEPRTVVEAHRMALARFAAEGQRALQARHLYALENHCFSSRISGIISSSVLG